MDYNDNEETTQHVVKTSSQGTWQGDTRTCEQGQVIYGCAVINRPPNMNERPDNADSKGNGGSNVTMATSESQKVITSWGKVSPTKQKNTSIGTQLNNALLEKSKESQARVNQNDSERSSNQMMTWKDVSPPKSPTELERNQHAAYALKNGKCDCACGQEGKSSCEYNCSHKPCSQSALSQSNGSFHENGSPKGEKGFNTSPEDTCNNDYFYDEDFTVQFDTNLRESSVTPSEGDTNAVGMLEFPHMVTGSYLSFNNMPGSSNLSINNMRGSSVLRNDDRGQYDSEFSGSRNSTMEISSSEREMMCSSDLIDLSDGPLFTPTPTHNLSTDSLDKCNREGHQGVVNSGQDMLGSNVSGEANLGVDCCPKKEEYFLSFDGSQTRVSSSETDCSLTSHDSGQGHWNHSETSTSHDSLPGQGAIYVCDPHVSGGEEQEESSDSFHFCYTGSKLSPLHRQNHQYVGRENLSGRVLKKKLLPLQESVESSEDDSGEACKTSPTLTAGSKESPFSPFNSPQKKPFSKPLTDSITKTKEANTKALLQKGENLYLVGVGKQSDIFMKGSSKSLPAKNLMSWKQIKGLKKLGKSETSKCVSMPELSSTTSWQSISALKCRKVSDICDSFHSKRHSATLLDFYQRMKSQSNPVSPETMNNIEQILMPKNFVGQKLHQAEMSDSSTSSAECTQCQCHQRLPPLSRSVTKAYTNKRIFDWLKMECSNSSRPNSLACQTNRLHECATKETLISPQTVTMWCGTKNFGSQFPPLTKDCGIQTSFYAENVAGCRKYTCVLKKDQEIQTSNNDETEILSLLSETYDDFDFLRSNEGTAKEFQRPLSCPEGVRQERTLSSRISRSKSADEYRECNDMSQLSCGSDMFNANVVRASRESRSRQIGRSKSAGRLSNKSESPLRRMGFSNHYSYQSLPDLAFLNSSISLNKEESHESLFDPMKLDMPVPLFITPKTELENFEIYQRKSHCCSHHKSHCSENKSKSAIHRNVKQAESASSSSGFSTSSTSSGIDPGYCTCENRSSSNSSPHNDLERLIFYPPHTEALKPAKCCISTKKRAHSVPKCLSEYTNTPINIKLDRYAYEFHPAAVNQVPQGKSRVNQKYYPATKSTGMEPASVPVNEDLYSVEEEQTPVQSPEKQECCHGKGCHNCHQEEHFHSNPIHDKVRRREQYTYDSSDFYRAVVNDQMLNIEHTYFREFSTDSASSSGSYATANDKKPLKSCLRKRNRALRSRSMSDPFTLNLEEIKQREKVKNRHSYACDEVYIVSDEFGQLMMYQADDSAEPVMFYLDKDGECHMTEGGKQLDVLQNQSVSGSDSSTERESSNKRKSVSFASEVSFQSISPTASPKKQVTEKADQKEDVPNDQEMEPVAMEKEDTSIAPNPEKVPESRTSGVEGSTSSSGSDTAPEVFPVAMETEDTTVTAVIDVTTGFLKEVSLAAELLVAHFSKSKNLFDKLTLGDTAETPEIGDMVLGKLCPALSQVLSYGMRRHLVGFQMFGRVQVTVWKVVEASVEIIPQTRAISDLVNQLKQTASLVTQQQKFNTFIFGLLNLRLLDFWMTYIKQKDDLLTKFYEADSILIQANTTMSRDYDEMLTSLQPLAVFPFQLNFDFMKERNEMTDSKIKIENSESKLGSPEKKLSNQNMSESMMGNDLSSLATSEVTSVLELTASKALNWLAGATFPKKKSGRQESSATKSKSLTFPVSQTMTDSGHLTNSMTMSQSFSENLTRPASTGSSGTDQPVTVKKLTSAYTDAKISCIDADRIISPNESLMSANSEMSTSTSESVSFEEEIENSPKTSTNNSTPVNLISPSLTNSATSLVTKLLNLGSGLGQKQAYKKGVTEYNFEQENEAESTKKGSGGTPSVGGASRLHGEAISSHKGPVESPVSPVKADTITVVKRPTEKSKESANKRPSKRVSFDIVNFFDKLLLPSPKSEKPSPKSGYRWSWGVGGSGQATSDKQEISGKGAVSTPDLPSQQAAAVGLVSDDTTAPPPKPPRLYNQKQDQGPELNQQGEVNPDKCAKLSPPSPNTARQTVSYDINSNTQEV